jgi:hypothetical protein
MLHFNLALKNPESDPFGVDLESILQCIFSYNMSKLPSSWKSSFPSVHDGNYYEIDTITYGLYTRMNVT